MRQLNIEKFNSFMYSLMYKLLYPAILGAVICSIIEDFFKRGTEDKGIFSILFIALLAWIYIIDFYKGTTDFKDKQDKYKLMYFICDISVVLSLFSAYYNVWCTNNDLFLYLSIFVLCILLLLYNAFIKSTQICKQLVRTMDVHVIKYMVILIILCLCTILIICTLNKGYEFYEIFKLIYLFILAIAEFAHTIDIFKAKCK